MSPKILQSDQIERGYKHSCCGSHGMVWAAACRRSVRIFPLISFRLALEQKEFVHCLLLKLRLSINSSGQEFAFRWPFYNSRIYHKMRAFTYDSPFSVESFYPCDRAVNCLIILLWKRAATVKIDKTDMKQMFADRLLRLCSGFDYLRHWRGFFVGRDSPVNV